MTTAYDVLGVRRNASDEAIRAAFRKAAKAHHPDLNAGDPTVEQQLRQVIAAYKLLKNPRERAAYDRYLRNSRRVKVRRFATPAVASLVSGSVVAAVVWLSVWLWKMQGASSGYSQMPRIAAAKVSRPGSQQGAAAVDSRDLQQPASGRRPTAGHTEQQALLAKEFGQVQASGEPMAIWAFAVRNPDAPETELAWSKLLALTDATEDLFLLHVLRIGAPDAISERAQQRLVRLGALAVAPER